MLSHIISKCLASFRLRKLPVDSPPVGIRAFHPSFAPFLKSGYCGNTIFPKAFPRVHANLGFSLVQPTGMFRGKMHLKSSPSIGSPLGTEVSR